MSEPYYITTAIAYPNGDPHVGHAYEYIATDAIARFKRLDGFDVRFLTGTDVHGLKMAETAAAEGIPTAELARRNSDVFQRMQEQLDISFDRFIRTSDADHYEASKEIWRRMNEAGDIYLDAYKGWYSVRDERFFTEAETTVGADGVRIATETGAPVTWTEEQTYFFRLSAYADKLLAHYEAHPEFIEPDVRRNEVVSFVSGGLRDLSISRTTFDWGVPVPDHPDHVMYVWVDALTNYLTGVGFPDTSSELFKRFWPADLHMIGKDIIRFHTVYWPAFLMSAGIELPRKVFVHGFSAQPRREDEQVGRQRRRPGEPRRHVRGRPGALLLPARGAVRAGRQLQRGSDHRPHQRRPGQRVGQPGAAVAVDGGQEPRRNRPRARRIHRRRQGAAGGGRRRCWSGCAAHFDATAMHLALEAIWSVLGAANKYFSAQEPWVLRKDRRRQRFRTVLYTTLEIVRIAALLSQPVMPESTGKLLDLLGQADDQRTFAAIGTRLAPGTALPAPVGVFPRYQVE